MLWCFRCARRIWNPNLDSRTGTKEVSPHIPEKEIFYHYSLSQDLPIWSWKNLAMYLDLLKKKPYL